MMAEQAYPSGRLDLDGNSFRLAELQPGRPEDPVYVRLVHVRLGGDSSSSPPPPPPYEALSYTWGDPAQTEPIRIVVGGGGSSKSSDSVDSSTSCGSGGGGDGGGGGGGDDGGGSTTAPTWSPLHVTVSCVAALRRLRRPDAPRRLWIDAVCIDQGSVAERNHQLGLMTRIYSGAGRVVAYLGERGGDSDAAMDWIREVDEPSDFDEPPRHDEPPRVAQPDPAMMVALLGRAWFGRVWVIQEVAAARDAVVVCGDREVRWAAFRAFRYWNHTTRWVRELPFAVDSALALHATPSYVLLPYASRLFQKLVTTRRCGATDRRDKFYAILPLLQLEEAYFRAAQAARGDSSDDDDEPDDDKPEAAAAPRPAKWPPALRSADYSLPAVRVFTELARSLIDGVGLGAVLRTVVLPAAVPGLPSWAPDWSVTPCNVFKGRRARGNQLSLDSEYFTGVSWAGAESQPWRFAEYGASPSSGPLVQLHAQSVCLGTIARIGDVCDINGDYFPAKQWAGLVSDPAQLLPEDLPPPTDDSYESHHSWEVSKLPVFVRALAGDFVVYREALEGAYGAILAYNGDSDDEDMNNRYRPETADASLRQEIVDAHPYSDDALRACQEASADGRLRLKDIFNGWVASYAEQAEVIFFVCHGRRFFVTDTGRLGLAPPLSAVGDVVLSLRGATAPFVLSGSHGGGDAKDESGALRLVGQCFVQGVNVPELWEPKEGNVTDSWTVKEVVIR